MSVRLWLTFAALAVLPSSVAAQTSDFGRSLSQLVDTVVTSGKQRKLRAELSSPLTYQPAAGPLDPANANDPRNFDVAGVRLGMTVREAQSALRAAGYVDRGPRDGQESYIDRVTYQWMTDYGVQGRSSEGATKEIIWNKGEEEVIATFIALPDGPRVDSVFYQAKESAPISVNEFTRRVLSKYGEPANDDPANMKWCTVKAPDCEQPPEQEYPLLVAWPSTRQVRLYGDDPARKAALEQRFETDVERRKPADRAPSF